MDQVTLMLSKSLQRQLYDYFVYSFKYKIGIYTNLNQYDLYIISADLQIPINYIIKILKLCKWCKIKSKGLFKKSYNIFIFKN